MRLKAVALLAACSSTVAAQTYSSCNPLQGSYCPADTALSSSTYSVDFTQGANDQWEATAGSVTYGSNGAEFTIRQAGDAPTIQTNWYIFFGRVSVTMRSAPGTGIVSSAILESDDLDEIDWEFLGGDTSRIESDYFGKGNNTGTREVDFIISGIQEEFHNYTLVWTSQSITWYVDGAIHRVLTYDAALSGTNYPQTPMRIRLGIWAGGDPGNPSGTIAWAGGTTDYSQGPFTMYVQSVEIENYNPASSYSYGDETGHYSSIKITGGGSTNLNGNSPSGGTPTTSSGASGTTGYMWWTAAASAVRAQSNAAGSVRTPYQTVAWPLLLSAVCFTVRFLY